MYYQVIVVFHVLFGLGIVGLVLMQQGKGADAGAAFGTGSSGSVFGAQGAASFLSRSTAILATLFFLTSLGLAIMNSYKGPSYDLMSAPATEQAAPEAPKANDSIPVVSEKTAEKPAAAAPTAPKADTIPAPAANQAAPVAAQPATPAAPEATKK